MEPVKNLKPEHKPEIKTEVKPELKAKPGKYEILARHSPFPKKKMTIEAASQEEAWAKFCEINVAHAEKLLNFRESGGDTKKYKKIWVNDVKSTAKRDRAELNVIIKELV